MLRLLYYFSFSAKLSLVLNIIANASIDIMLFMMMFIIVIIFIQLNIYRFLSLLVVLESFYLVLTKKVFMILPDQLLNV